MRSRKERGGELLEFTLGTTIFILPVLLGTWVIGSALTEQIQATTICRDLAHMYAYGVEMSLDGSKEIAYEIGKPIGLQAENGDAVAIFSTVIYIEETDCTAAGVTGAVNTTNCPNLHQAVITKRLTIGNTTKQSSHFVTPNPALIGTGGSAGQISAANFIRDLTVRVPRLTEALTLTSGQPAYLTEVFAATPDLNWSGLSVAVKGVYSHMIY